MNLKVHLYNVLCHLTTKLETNMKKIILIAAVCAVFLIGCDSDSRRKKNAETNLETLSKEGEHVGTLPDGRSVQRYVIKYYLAEHYIYVIGSDVTNNFSSHKHNDINAVIGSKSE